MQFAKEGKQTVSSQQQAADASMAASTEDWADQRVPASERRPIMSIVVARMGFTVSATDLVYGISLGLYFPFWLALAIALGSSVIIIVVSILGGLIGQREGLTTALCLRQTFGNEGVRFPALVIALIGVGFAGYSTGITVSVLPGDSNLAHLLYAIVLGALYTALSIVGFKQGLTWVGRIAVPLMLVMVIIAAVRAIDHVGGWGALLAKQPSQPSAVAIPIMIGLGINKWMQGATVTPDIMRFGKDRSSVYVSTIAEFLVGNFGFNLLGIIVGLGVGVANLGDAFAAIGIGTLAIAAIVVQGFPHEVNNMYAASLAARTTFGIPRLFINIASGVIVIIVAYYGVTTGILESFLAYLGWLGYIMPIIPGIFIADYFLVRRCHYGSTVASASAFNLRAMSALIIGLGLHLYLGIALDDGLLKALPVFGFALYLLFSIPQLIRAWSSKEPRTAEVDELG